MRCVIAELVVQVQVALEGCISAEAAQEIAAYEASALITADAAEREAKNEEKLQVPGPQPLPPLPEHEV
jgi:hypothetical protein